MASDRAARNGNGHQEPLSNGSPSNGRMLTVTQVALHLNVHANSIRRWADMGLLPAYRIGLRGDRRFHAEDVEVFLESSCRKSNGLVADTDQRNGHHA